MPKSNPFFNYISEFKKSLMTSKTIIKQRSNFLVIELDPPKQCLLPLQEKNIHFNEHHVTVYKTIDEQIGFESLYHYTAISESSKLHVYFDEKDRIISVILSENDGENIDLSHELLSESNNLQLVNATIDKQMRPVIQYLRTQHLTELDTQKNNYIRSIEHINAQLFYSSEDIAGNIKLIKEAKKQGEKLLPISYQTSFLRKTLTFLDHTAIALRTIPKEASSISTAITSKDAVDNKSVATTISNKKTKAKAKEKTKSVTIRASKAVQQELKEFEEAYARYQTKWKSFLDCSAIENRLELFTELRDDLSYLHGLDLLNSENERKSISECNTDLNIALLQEKYSITGSELLSTFLQTGQALSDEQEEILKDFVELISTAQKEAIIMGQNLAALKFLLTHDNANTNNFSVKFDDEWLSPLCAAYKHGNHDMFELLLQHNASAMAILDDLPLAHTILQLPVADKFRCLLMEKNQKIFDRNPSFFKALAATVDEKIKDPTVNEEKKHALIESHKDYLAHASSVPSVVMKSTKAFREHVSKNVSKMVNTINLDALETFKEEQMLVNELREKSNRLLLIMKKKHMAEKLLMDGFRQCQSAQQLIDPDMLQSLSKEDLINGLKINLSKIDAYITIINLTTKPRTKHENKRYLAALQLVNEQNNDSASDDIAALRKFIQETLYKHSSESGSIAESLESIASKFINTVDRILSIKHEDKDTDAVDEDEYASLDFLVAAGLNTVNSMFTTASTEENSQSPKSNL